VENEKDLGIIIDTRLNFEKHMEKKVNKANSIMAMIRRAFQYMDRNIFGLLYKGLVRNALEYGGAVWSPYKMKDIMKVEGVQRRATASLPGMKDKTYEERLRELGLPTLRFRRARGDMIETYKMIHGIYDKEVIPDLKLQTDLRTTSGARRVCGKHSLSLYQCKTRLQQRANSFNHRVVEVWNSLPENVVTAPSVNAFKNRIDKVWKDNKAMYDFRIGIMGETEQTEDEE